ncbi:MAG: hypothetical protein GY851_11235, partial [bacterium]|nr:hypothetical protein [bacterium]
MRTKFFTSMVTPILAVLVAAAYPTGAAADSMMHARVSFESGGALVMGTDDDDWSFATLNTLILPGDILWADNGASLELELNGGTFVRMADGSKLEVSQLGRDMLFNGWTGAFYVHRVKRSSGEIRLQTPACSVEIEKDSLVRVDVVGEGATTVSVRWGRAKVHTDIGRPVTVREGKRTFVDPGFLPSTPLPFDRNAEDEFDTWNRQRAKLLALGNDPFPSQTVVKEVPVGYADLTPHGNWVYVDSEPYWQPTAVVDYVPYRHGHWSYVPAYGYTWIGNYPFSYVTSHYGRWRNHARHGWIWTYRDTWGPAWVASARYGSNFVWSPLDIYDRPCVVTGATFSVGGIRFSVYSSTACLANDLYLGPCSVYACTPTIVTGVPHTQIGIWDIYSSGYQRPQLPIFGSPDLVREYSPRRVIRGPSTYGSRSAHATSRVATLESSRGREQFTTVRNTGSRGLRTPFTSAARSARVRSVSVNPEARLNTYASVRRVERGASPAVSSIESRGVRSLRSTSPTSRTGSSSSTNRTARTSRGSSTPSVRGRSTTPSASAPSRTTRTSVSPRTSSRTRSTAPNVSEPSRTTRPSVTSTPSRTTRPSVTSTPSRTTRPSVTSTPSRTTRPSVTS